MSESDAVDGSSTGASVPWMWALLRLPRFRGANHADDNDNRFRHRQVSFPGSRRRRWRPSDHSLRVEAPLRLGVFLEAVTLEACASAHHWSRQLQALWHTMWIIPPS